MHALISIAEKLFTAIYIKFEIVVILLSLNKLADMMILLQPTGPICFKSYEWRAVQDKPQDRKLHRCCFEIVFKVTEAECQTKGEMPHIANSCVLLLWVTLLCKKTSVLV